MNGGVSQQGLCSARQLAEATGGTLVQGPADAVCAAATTDSRRVPPRSLFVALRGERFDGARFCAQAVAGGAVMVLVARDAWQQGVPGVLPPETAVVCVEDPLRALGDLAAWHRARHRVKLVGITGSNGKTTTKFMAVAVLGGPEGVLYNRGNLNNLVGMPRALLELNESHRHAVLEMGMNAPGEIRRLSQIAQPQVGVITNVHPAHLLGLGSLQAVAEAKGELFESLTRRDIAVVNADDPLVLSVSSRTAAMQLKFGRAPHADVRLLSAQADGAGVRGRLSLEGRAIEVRLGRPGLHNLHNAAAAAAVGLALGISAEDIEERLPRTRFAPLRMEPLSIAGATVLVDCYNANPRSMAAALETLAELAGSAPRAALLGEMRELGTASAEFHRDVGRAAARVGVGELCLFGAEVAPMAAGAADGGLASVLSTADIDEAASWLEQRLRPGTWVLVKGSRGVALERIVRLVAARHGIEWDYVHED